MADVAVICGNSLDEGKKRGKPARKEIIAYLGKAARMGNASREACELKYTFSNEHAFCLASAGTKRVLYACLSNGARDIFALREV